METISYNDEVDKIFYVGVYPGLGFSSILVVIFLKYYGNELNEFDEFVADAITWMSGVCATMDLYHTHDKDILERIALKSIRRVPKF